MINLLARTEPNLLRKSIDASGTHCPTKNAENIKKYKIYYQIIR